MQGTKPWAIGVVVICTIFTAIGSLLLKKGIDRFSMSWQGALDAYLVIVGLFVYFLGFILLTLAFRHGELSVLFPFVSLSFVWVAFLSYFFLGEIISVLEMLGVAAIVCGVILIGSSGRNNKKLRLRS
jgi:drug/metabolite transporter (DMT)-like permease